MSMPALATWLRKKDEQYFQPFFDKHPQIKIWNAMAGEVPLKDMDGLLLTGGSDIAPEFLRQEIVDPSVLDKDVDPARDRWELGATADAVARGLPILGICKGIQILNVALGGTLKLDVPGHRLPEQRVQDVQPLRCERTSQHRFSKVNSAHHQAIDRLGEGLEVEAWCASDDIIEQVRLRNHPFALAVQYHPERGTIYDSLFEDFFSRLNNR